MTDLTQEFVKSVTCCLFNFEL